MTAPKVSWKPGRSDSSGSARRMTSAAAPSRLDGFHRRARIMPALAPSAQQAERVTEACGSTRATYPAIRRKESDSPSLGGARHAEASSVIEPASTARLKPEIAMRWARPAWVNRRSISPLPRASRPRSMVCRSPHASASHQLGMTRCSSRAMRWRMRSRRFAGDALASSIILIASNRSTVTDPAIRPSGGWSVTVEAIAPPAGLGLGAAPRTLSQPSASTRAPTSPRTRDSSILRSCGARRRIVSLTRWEAPPPLPPPLRSDGRNSTSSRAKVSRSGRSPHRGGVAA
jgi:hypothetical protein